METLLELLMYGIYLGLAMTPFLIAAIAFSLWRLVRISKRIADRLDEFGIPSQSLTVREIASSYPR